MKQPINFQDCVIRNNANKKEFDKSTKPFEKINVLEWLPITGKLQYPTPLSVAGIDTDTQPPLVLLSVYNFWNLLQILSFTRNCITSLSFDTQYVSLTSPFRVGASPASWVPFWNSLLSFNLSWALTSSTRHS